MDDRRPLADQRPAPGSAEAAASAMLRRVPEPEAIDDVRLARIGRRLEESGTPQRWRPLTFGLGATFSAAVMALVMGWSHLAAPEVWRVPEGSVVKLLREGRVNYILVGPAQASHARDDWQGSLKLERGRVVARAAAGPLQIETPRGLVLVRQGATAEVALEKTEVVIAAFDAAVLLQPRRALPFGLTLGRPAQAAQEIQPGQSLVVTERGLLRRQAVQPSLCAVELAGQVPELACSPAPERAPATTASPPLQAPDAVGAPAPVADAAGTVPSDLGQPLGPEPEAQPAPAPVERTAARRRARRVQSAPAAPATPASGTAAAKDGGAAAPDAATTESGPLVAESRLLTRALQELRQRRDGQKALAVLDEYGARFPRGMLAQESKLARIDALLLLRRRTEVLAAIEDAPLSRWPRGRELLVLRAELRAEANRCDAALGDFTAALRNDAGSLEERALYGRGACRARRGDPLGAQADFRDYLRRFPGGSHAAAVRRAIGEP